ncbi:MAG: zinc ribbon domain-containing protein [Nitrososphaeria archaeon]
MEVNRFVKTTGVCPVCGTRVELNLSDRSFTCPSCGSWFDRDVASATVIMKEGLCLWNAGETLGDDRASTADMLEYFNSIPHVTASAPMNREAPTVRLG